MSQINLTTAFQDVSALGEPRQFYLSGADNGVVVAVEAGASLGAVDGVEVARLSTPNPNVVGAVGTTITDYAGSAQYLRYRVVSGDLGAGVVWGSGSPQPIEPQLALTDTFQDFSALGSPREFFLAGAAPGTVVAVEAGSGLAALNGVEVSRLSLPNPSVSGAAGAVVPYAGSAQYLRYRAVEGDVTGADLWVGGPSAQPRATSVIYMPDQPSLWIPSAPSLVSTALDQLIALLTSAGSAAFGGGEDGVAVFDGVNVFSFATLVGSTYTLSRGCYLTAGHVLPGITLNTNGYRGPFCNGMFVLDGTIDISPGKAAVGSVAGGSSALGTLGIGMAGGAGRTNAVGQNGTNQSNGMYDATGAGGAGGAGGVNAGGTGGTYGRTTSGTGGENTLVTGILGFLSAATSGGNQAQLYPIGGGAGGGGGGSDNVDTAGGGGGGGAGMGLLSLYYFINNGIVRAVGGRGGNAVGAHNGGGGGGGGGGAVLGLSRVRGGTSWNPATPLSWVNASGGLGGAGVGAGVAGSPGSAGHVHTHWA